YDNAIHVTRSFASIAAVAGGAGAHSSQVAGLLALGGVRSRGRAMMNGSGIQADSVCLVMHIGTSDNFQERRWPPERYARLADRLVEAFQVRVVFTGLEDEAFLIR